VLVAGQRPDVLTECFAKVARKLAVDGQIQLELRTVCVTVRDVWYLQLAVGVRDGQEGLEVRVTEELVHLPEIRRLARQDDERAVHLDHEVHELDAVRDAFDVLELGLTVELDLHDHGFVGLLSPDHQADGARLKFVRHESWFPSARFE
jgi:hypothetical protein